jgi:hypothetical protein
MEKITLEKSVKDLLINNYDKYSKYLDIDFQVFKEIKRPVEEAAKCLLFEFHKASICLTSNIVERLMKLSLIYNEAGIKQVSIEKWNEVFSEPHNKYGSLPLGKAIELCKEQELITQTEQDYLIDALKKIIINGYSDADPGKLKNNIIDEMNGDGLNGLKKDELKQKMIPPLQSIQIENFAKTNALRYFEFAFELICNIENRLIEKDGSSSGQ